MVVVSLRVVGEAHTGGGLEEEEIGGVVPGIGVESEIVAFAVVDTLFHVVGANFLQESYITTAIPSMEEQPGPPFSHKVTGSLLFLPFIDSTNM